MSHYAMGRRVSGCVPGAEFTVKQSNSSSPESDTNRGLLELTTGRISCDFLVPVPGDYTYRVKLEWMDSDGQMDQDGWMRMDGCGFGCGWRDVNADGQMQMWKDGQMQMEGCKFGCGQMDADVNGWVHNERHGFGWIEVNMDGWMQIWMGVCRCGWMDLA